MQVRRVNRRVAAGLAGALLMAGCANTATLAFTGRCVDTKGKAVATFKLSVARGSMPARFATVTTAQGGQYQATIPVDKLANAPAGVLGTRDEKVALTVEAPGYRTKTFNVTAEQLFTDKPNNLNVTLQPQ